jgi:hypothetical protein
MGDRAVGQKFGSALLVTFLNGYPVSRVDYKRPWGPAVRSTGSFKVGARRRAKEPSPGHEPPRINREDVSAGFLGALATEDFRCFPTLGLEFLLAARENSRTKE